MPALISLRSDIYIPIIYLYLFYSFVSIFLSFGFLQLSTLQQTNLKLETLLKSNDAMKSNTNINNNTNTNTNNDPMIT